MYTSLLFLYIADSVEAGFYKRTAMYKKEKLHKVLFTFTRLDEPNACSGRPWQRLGITKKFLSRSFLAERSEVGALEFLKSLSLPPT